MRIVALALALVAACGSDAVPPLATAKPGVVFAYPTDGMIDVPLGANVIVTFSDPIVMDQLACNDATSGPFCIVGPAGPVTVMPQVSMDGKTIVVPSPGFAEGGQYQIVVGSALEPTAQNLPATGALVTFTARADRPRAAAPTLVSVNGGDPANPESFRPMFEASTIRLVFSEPLDPRTVTASPGSVELFDGGGNLVPATVIAKDIHVSIDPIADLTAGMTYTLRLNSSILDLGGQALAPVEVKLTPQNSVGSGTTPQLLRTRQMGDPGTAAPRTGFATNTIVLNHPLIGQQTEQLLPATVASELGDPKALGGPIAFTMRRGQRFHVSGLNVAFGGVVPSGLSTQEIEIELLTDGGGRLYRNPNQSPDQSPENDRAPVYVDFSLDVAVYATDPMGNAVLSQTVLGLQAAGIATPTEGVLDIETASAMDLGLLGLAQAPSNLVLELITDATATPPSDTTPPTLVSTFPAASSDLLPVDGGIELVFSEPIDLDRARNGGLVLETGTNTMVPFELESHGAAVVLRPLTRFAYSTAYQVVFDDVRDVAGNQLASQVPMIFTTAPLASTGVPLTIVSAHPGAPCALNGTGQCSGGQSTDDAYPAFTLPANDVARFDFSQPLAAGSIALGAQCNAGDVRVEQVDGSGACSATVPGTLIVEDRALVFVPDVPWAMGTHYRVTLVSGGNSSCNAGEICGIQDAASWDPLTGTTSGAGGGPNLVVDFTGDAPTTNTIVFATASPFTDTNGSGFVDGAELPAAANSAALRITGTSGAVSAAHFNGPDCIASTPDVENCLYLQGAMPTALQPAQQNCTLPDGSTAASCVPVVLSGEAMYGTSVNMTATVLISISTDTGTSIMRLREPQSGPIMGYIVDHNGPTFVTELNLYMDAPDMSLPLTTHDLHSKPLTVDLSGPVTFMPDGRIAISVANTADVPVTVNTNTDIVGNGAVDMIVPAGYMKLQLVSPPVRGAPL
ncbi:MAG TPA: Ig-like domain-containing protein [Kofleriaceae bacterium]|nr:Ig-like domain-containing protein [Kofleriaceae bacterium]